ncbi:MAG: hypothetical protein WCY19_02025 [Candidatus Gastranaerophilaceae bacterium]
MIKKLIYILILFITFSHPASAQTQNAYLEYSGYQYAFKPGDEAKFLKNANSNILLFEKSTETAERVFYLQEAMRYYFLLSKIKPKSIDAQIGLGRIYDELGLDSYAKKHFFVALDFNNKNPRTNYYLGDFYYRRSDLLEALMYYKKAYANGYSNNYKLNYKMAVIYEKLADIESAKKFYSNTLKITPQNAELGNKIRLLDELNYDKSQYYLFRR